MDLYRASNQWATRPADERFWTVAHMTAACLAYAKTSVQSTINYAALKVEAQDHDNDLVLIGKTGNQATLTHWAFGQLARRVGAPANYLRELPPTLAAQNLNHGLAHKAKKGERAKLLLHQFDSGNLARCFTSAKYQRIWNYQIGQQLQALEEYGWRVPPARPAKVVGTETRPATKEDLLRSGKFGLSINEGDLIGPAGVYASDRDMFVFLINDDHLIENPLDPNTPLARGMFVWNSEVGDKSFGVTTFLYDHVCGNHIVWGAKEVKEVKIRHIGSAIVKSRYMLQIKMKQLNEQSQSDLNAQIKASQTYEIAALKEDVISEILKFAKSKRLNVINQKNVNEAYMLAERTPRYGNPHTPWAIAQGLTEISQSMEHANRRSDLDRAAGRLVEIAF